MQMTLLLHLKLWGWCCAVVRILLLIAALSSNPPRICYLLSPVLHLPHALLAFILVVSHFPSWHRFTSWQPSLQSQWCWGYQFQTPWYVKEGQLLTCYLPKSWSLYSNPSLSILLLSSLWLWTLVPPMPCSSEHWKLVSVKFSVESGFFLPIVTPALFTLNCQSSQLIQHHLSLFEFPSACCYIFPPDPCLFKPFSWLLSCFFCG